jgi:cyclopropane fatty-acyl-phospholipid synthase-like methyltransferase
MSSVVDREQAYYDAYYATEGPVHFGKPAVVAFREYLVGRIVAATGAGPETRVLSIGCGIGDTELLLARHVAHVTGVDLSPKAIAHAQSSAASRGVLNTEFLASPWESARFSNAPFDLMVAVFFLHHLSDDELSAFPGRLLPLLKGGGKFYALEPSIHRLSGRVGKLLIPRLMKKYQTDDERQLQRHRTAGYFKAAGFDVVSQWFDFVSTPLAGLFPAWKTGYRMARAFDGPLTRCPGLRGLSSNFDLVAVHPVKET